VATQLRLEKIKQILDKRQTGTIILEDMYDPHNAAAVFRTVEAFGFATVHLVFDKEITFNPKKVGKKSSASANKWLEFVIHSSIDECIEHLKKQGFTIFATAIDEHAQSIYETNLAIPKVALMFGNEHRGLSKKAMELADHTLYIPMRGFVQSLNLSVTAAICLYEITRQRHKK